MIKYYKLLDMLNRHSMTKEELRQQTGISSATMSKISAHKAVSLTVIDKICCALNCQPGDIIEYVPAAPRQEPRDILPGKPEKHQQQEPAQQATEPIKRHTQYRRFTESEAAQIDPGRILTDGLYQLQIARDFGMDVLNTLVAKARQQAGQVPNTTE